MRMNTDSLTTNINTMAKTISDGNPHLEVRHYYVKGLNSSAFTGMLDSPSSYTTRKNRDVTYGMHILSNLNLTHQVYDT